MNLIKHEFPVVSHNVIIQYNKSCLKKKKKIIKLKIWYKEKNTSWSGEKKFITKIDNVTRQQCITIYHISFLNKHILTKKK